MCIKMEQATLFLLGLSLLVIIILITRLLGAWMLRINDVIKIQKDTLNELYKVRKHLDKMNQITAPPKGWRKQIVSS